MPLDSKIKSLIKEKGSIKISEFMNLALFDKDLGYYKTKNPIGKNSDFITAPEVSQIFGELIAAYFIQISDSKNKQIAFVEMGAGQGTLLFDIISTAKKLADKNIAAAVNFVNKTSFHIVETNPILKQIQQEKLAPFSVAWHENFDDFLEVHSAISKDGPRRKAGVTTEDNGVTTEDNGVTAEGNEVTTERGEARVERCEARAGDTKSTLSSQSALSPRLYAGVHYPGCEIFFLSNELFDCFAIDQFVKTDIGWCERKIALQNDLLQFITDKFNPETNNFIEKIIGFEASQQAPFGAVFEYSLDARNFMQKLANSIKSSGGIALNIDYGYIKNEFANSLQAVKNHQKYSVLEKAGELDITALVDFSSLIKITQDCGLNFSLVTQAEFLLALGIEERRKTLLESGAKEDINLAVDRLIDSGQMGELFKCLIIWN